MSAPESEAWAVLTRTPGLSMETLAAVLTSAGSAAQLLTMSSAARRRAGLSPRACEYLSSSAARLSDAEACWLEHDSHRLLDFLDPQFPPLLRHLVDCPFALYIDGSIETLTDPQLAIVGSRNPTATGRDDAFDFSRSLSLAGFTIVSGLAEGIDAAAHRGALAAGGSTIAVLGTGIDIIYPLKHDGLAREISTKGALVSEFALGMPALRENFPRRNRVIAGLSLGTLVVEAAKRSGSLITARLAGEAGRDVFAIPGSIHNPRARGCHELIRQGAKLTECIDDILTELRPGSAVPSLCTQASRRGPAQRPMDKQQEILLDALGFEPAGLDVLIERTGQSAQVVSAQLLVLELEGYVTSAHGGRFARRQEPVSER